jgi:hypothetical protein
VGTVTSYLPPTDFHEGADEAVEVGNEWDPTFQVTIDDRGLSVEAYDSTDRMSLRVTRLVHAALGRYLAQHDTPDDHA